jgi:hypothetical protein
MPTTPDIRARVVDERRELAARLAELEAYQASEAFRALAFVDAVLVAHQAKVMAEYLRMLDARILRFRGKGKG